MSKYMRHEQYEATSLSKHYVPDDILYELLGDEALLFCFKFKGRDISEERAKEYEQMLHLN